MKNSKCKTCKEYASCNVASLKSACMVHCPYYISVKGIKNPSMKIIGEQKAIKKQPIGRRRTTKELKKATGDVLVNAKTILKALPKLFTATQFHEVSIDKFGSPIALSKQIKRAYLEPNGKGFYINKFYIKEGK